LNIGGIIHESLNDGAGVRTVIFISGCKHNCDGCQNKRLFDFGYGKPFDETMQNYVLEYVETDKLIDGITISGGDPLYSATELLDFVKKFKSKFKDKTIWLYTGFNFEDVKNLEILKYIDVLVDGAFQIETRNITIPFRGSENQRLIDVKKTLSINKIVLYETRY